MLHTKSYLFSTHPVESHTFLPCVYDVCMLFSALVSPNLILLFHFELFHNPNRPAVRPVLFGRRARALDFDSARPHVRKAHAEFLPVLKGFFYQNLKLITVVIWTVQIFKKMSELLVACRIQI